MHWPKLSLSSQSFQKIDLPGQYCHSYSVGRQHWYWKREEWPVRFEIPKPINDNLLNSAPTDSRTELGQVRGSTALANDHRQQQANKEQTLQYLLIIENDSGLL